MKTCLVTSKQSQTISASGDKATIFGHHLHHHTARLETCKLFFAHLYSFFLIHTKALISLICTKPKFISTNSQVLHKPVASDGSFKGKWKFHTFTTQIILDSERNGSKGDNRCWSLITKVVHWQWLISAPARRFRQAHHCIRCLPRQPLSPFQTCPASSKAQLSSLWWHQLWCWKHWCPAEGTDWWTCCDS